MGLLSIKMYLKPQVKKYRQNREAQGLNSEALQTCRLRMRGGMDRDGTELKECGVLATKYFKKNGIIYCVERSRKR